MSCQGVDNVRILITLTFRYRAFPIVYLGSYLEMFWFLPFQVLTPTFWRQRKVRTCTIIIIGHNHVQDFADLQTHQRNDPDLSKIMQKLEEGQNQPRYLLRNGLLYQKARYGDAKAVISITLIPSVLRAKHNDPTSGHLGVRKTLNRVRARYFAI